MKTQTKSLIILLLAYLSVLTLATHHHNATRAGSINLGPKTCSAHKQCYNDCDSRKHTRCENGICEYRQSDRDHWKVDDIRMCATLSAEPDCSRHSILCPNSPKSGLHAKAAFYFTTADVTGDIGEINGIDMQMPKDAVEIVVTTPIQDPVAKSSKEAGVSVKISGKHLHKHIAHKLLRSLPSEEVYDIMELDLVEDIVNMYKRSRNDTAV